MCRCRDALRDCAITLEGTILEENNNKKKSNQIADPHQDLFCVVYFVWRLCTGVLNN